MELRFTIPRKPCSVNQAYLRAGWGANRGLKGGKGFILSSIARDFKQCAAAHALVAARKASWPRPEAVRACEVEFVTWNTRHDADACVKLSLDSMERIVYTRDNVVRSVKASKAKDGGKPRVEVLVRLLD